MKKPISNKSVTVTTDGDSPKDIDTTNSKGEFEGSLKAPDSSGKHDIQAHFDGDSQYDASESSKSTITVEDATLESQKQTVTTDQPQTNEEQTNEEQTDEEVLLPTDYSWRQPKCFMSAMNRIINYIRQQKLAYWSSFVNDMYFKFHLKVC